MSLAPGTRIGSFEIVDALGAGGMGVVYRARDVRLDRTVAIKALSDGVGADPERLARFEREAKLLASLNHPNIAAIFGLEDVAGTPHLVLEYVDGVTLATRIAAGPLPVPDTLEVAGQIAAAIEAAHEGGVVHRDLKPGNVMLAGRTVKVLDFGLAKSSTAAAPTDLSASPTMALTATAQGLVLGTASYMSPEQARGRPVDRRADVWAFGCIVYECLTARRAFDGETASDVIARVLERDPDWAALPATVPARLRDLVRRCITKDAEQRPRDIGDLRRELHAIALDLSSPPPVATAGGAAPSLAVLYFENLARDADSEYFCDGVAEDIITDLSKLKGLRVASRNAVARYRGQRPDVAAVARELGVGAVLTGSVRRAGDRVRISVQLVNGADGFQLWGDRFDRTLDDVFAVQEEIASAIADALRVTLSPSDVRALVRDRPEDVRAYDLYLKGRAKYRAYTIESLHEALDVFRQAIAVEPDYALAWAGTADVYGQLLSRSGGKDSEAARLGLEAARKAITLDPRLAEAHKAEALVLRFTGDVDGAREALRRALAANPNFGPALVNLAIDRFSRGDLAGAERLVRRALALEPREPLNHLWIASFLFFSSRADAAARAVATVRALSDSPFIVTVSHAMEATLAIVRDDHAGALRAVRDGIAAQGDAGQLGLLEMALSDDGWRDKVGRALARPDAPKQLLPGIAMALADAAIRAGDIELALDMFKRSEMGEQAVLLRLSPFLHPLLDVPAFAPRRMDATLVWPLEAPMIDAARFALFREVKIESGLPDAEASGVHHSPTVPVSGPVSSAG